jgi:predicted secreted protein
MIRAATIEWGLLGEAAYISVGVGLGVLLVATIAVTSSLRSQDARAGGHEAAAVAFSALTVVCVIALAAAIVLGIYFMTDK